MENKMDAHLISNEKGQLAEEALESPQPQQQGPPSYTVNNVPIYPNGPTQPQQGFIIQNIPVQQNSGCCGGRSQWFKHSVGMTTGVIQLVLAIIACILSGVAIRMQILYADQVFSPAGSPIAATIFFFLPAGILGACTKGKNNCVIVGYLVMSILSAIQAVFVFGVEILASFRSVEIFCPDYFPYPEDDGIYVDYSCSEVRYKGLTAVHAVIAVLMFIEFIVAIVASAICCGGLNCCCPRSAPQTNTNNMMYYPRASMQPMPAQIGTPAAQGSELPTKA